MSSAAALFKFQPLTTPFLRPKPFPSRAALAAVRTRDNTRLSSVRTPISANPHDVAVATGRRAMLGMVVVGFSACSCSYSSSSSFSSEEEAFVRKTISSHDIVIFSKSYCPYCQMAKGVFKEMDKVPHVVELDEREDGNDIQDAIYDFVGRRTVPQVFIKGKHIGGSDDTIEAFENGFLAKLLEPESA